MDQARKDVKTLQAAIQTWLKSPLPSLHDRQEQLSALVESYLTLSQLANDATYAIEIRPSSHGEPAALSRLAIAERQSQPITLDEDKAKLYEAAANLADVIAGDSGLSPSAWQRAISKWASMLIERYPNLNKQLNFVDTEGKINEKLVAQLLSKQEIFEKEWAKNRLQETIDLREFTTGKVDEKKLFDAMIKRLNKSREEGSLDYAKEAQVRLFQNVQSVLHQQVRLIFEKAISDNAEEQDKLENLEKRRLAEATQKAQAIIGKAFKEINERPRRSSVSQKSSARGGGNVSSTTATQKIHNLRGNLQAAQKAIEEYLQDFLKSQGVSAKEAEAQTNDSGISEFFKEVLDDFSPERIQELNESLVAWSNSLNPLNTSSSSFSKLLPTIS